MRAAALALVAACWACWTGAEPDPATPSATTPASKPTPPFEVTLERTQCMGSCPSYTVTIRADGTVRWDGDAYVTEVGARNSHLSARELAELDRAIAHAHFFELDATGHVATPQCIPIGNGGTRCSAISYDMCTDSSHAIITVRRGHRVNRVDDPHCSDTPPALVELEDAIDRIADTGPWVGR